MRYKVLEGTTPSVRSILASRGIEDYGRWIDASYDEFLDYKSLDCIDDAVKMLNECIERRRDMAVIVDSDVDGFTSSAVLINFLYKAYPEYAEQHIKWLLHYGKMHGLEDMMERIDDNVSLAVLPDAGTNDVEFQNELVARGKKVLVIDHHPLQGKLNRGESVVIVNNQVCDYPNKSLTGAGVVWKVCRAYEDAYICDDGIYNYANAFLDLVALGNISDMADFREYEIRAIVNTGMDWDNIINSFILEMIENNAYTINKYGGLCYKGVAFGITPYINAICRSGLMEEKETVFQAMLDMCAEEPVPSGKRGEKNKLVPRYVEAVRVAQNVKARQTKEQNEATAVIEDRLNDDDAVIIAICSPDEAKPELCGLIANKLQAEHGKPAFVLIDNGTSYKGSARCPAGVPVDNFRQLCDDSKLTDYCAGHPLAFGASIPKDNKDKFVKYLNSKLSGKISGNVYQVDVVLPSGKSNMEFFKEMEASKPLWGQQISEPLAAIENVPMDGMEVRLLSPDKSPTMKINLPGGMQLLKFRSSEREVGKVQACLDAGHTMTVIGSCSINHWNGVDYPQVIIEDYEINQEWVF